MDRAQLLEDLTQNLSESGLRTLCARLGVPFQEVAGYNLQQKAAKLLDLLSTAERLPELVNELIRIRPYLAGKYEDQDQLSWLDQVNSGMGWATRSQITVNLSQLEDLTDDDKATVAPDRETQPSLAPLFETPTTRWRAEDPFFADLADSGFPPGVVNPYQIQGFVADPDHFFGRTAARRHLQTRLQNMGSSAIIGLSHAGKSSLLYYLSHHEQFDSAWHFLFAFFRLQQPIASLADLLNNTVRSWYQAMGRDRFPDVKTVADFARQVQFIGQSGYRPVLCLDDFEYLVRTTSILTDELLETWQTLGNAGRLAFVITCSRPLSDVLKSGGFYTGFSTIFNQVDLGLLTPDEAEHLVQDPALRQGITVPDSVMTELITYCGAHPFYLQLGAYHLFSGLWQDNDLSDRVVAAYQQTAVPFWRELWQQLSPLQQRLLSEPLLEDAPLVVARQYRFLARYGVLMEANGRYQFFSQAFAEWAAERSVH